MRKIFEHLYLAKYIFQSINLNKWVSPLYWVAESVFFGDCYIKEDAGWTEISCSSLCYILEAFWAIKAYLLYHSIVQDSNPHLNPLAFVFFQVTWLPPTLLAIPTDQAQRHRLQASLSHWISACSVLLVLSMSVTSPHWHFTRALERFQHNHRMKGPPSPPGSFLREKTRQRIKLLTLVTKIVTPPYKWIWYGCLLKGDILWKN